MANLTISGDDELVVTSCTAKICSPIAGSTDSG